MTSRARHRKRAFKAQSVFVGGTVLLGVLGLSSVRPVEALGVLAIGIALTSGVTEWTRREDGAGAAKEVGIVAAYSSLFPTVTGLTYPSQSVLTGMLLLGGASIIVLAGVTHSRTRSRMSWVAMSGVLTGVVFLL